MDGEIVTEKFILGAEGDLLNLGVTSGASTPDASVQDALASRLDDLENALQNRRAALFISTLFIPRDIHLLDVYIYVHQPPPHRAQGGRR